MRLSLRFIIPLALVLVALAYAGIPVIDSLTVKWFVRDLEIRSRLIAGTMEGPVSDLLQSKSTTKLVAYFHRIIQDERLYAIGICDQDHRVTYKTQTYPDSIPCSDPADAGAHAMSVVNLKQGPVHVASAPIEANGQTIGRLMLVHDMSWVQRRSDDTKRYLFYLFAIIGAVISLVTVLIAHLSWKGWVAGVRAMLRGEGLLTPLTAEHGRELQPVAQELRALFRNLEVDKRMRDESRITWTPAALRAILHDQLAGDEVLIVSNREPYIHNRRGQQIEIQVPASGVVSALEPIMRACSGVWIAHGSGTADREVVDGRDHVQVPPGHPAYDIRRVWMTPQEEAGYYYGFSNEGMWPLCHLAHVRPIFRSSDWKHYVAINERFAEAVLDEATTKDPVVLVQDYHFALLPKLIRDRLPSATIITFWHIPWPNAERYSICPWRVDILEGLLGSSILGFHTRAHCNNFIESVDRLLEARIDHGDSTISYGNKLTAVNAYPISIEWPVRWVGEQSPIADCRARIRHKYGMPPEHLVGIGVERLDYTKGVLERFLAVERLLELEPEWIGKFSFVQLAAPSRTSIDQYQQFNERVTALAERINRRFGHGGYQPIHLEIRHHEPPEVYEHFRAADLCIVSSLHDGMNLVAKEFVAAREDEQGVLILSQFTGASRELPEAVLVNPYDIDECAAAIRLGLTMPAGEQRARMRSMRGLIQEFNVYRWAGRMLMDAARLRQRARVLTMGSASQPAAAGVTP